MQKADDAVDKQKLKLDMSIGMRKNTAPMGSMGQRLLQLSQTLQQTKVLKACLK